MTFVMGLGRAALAGWPRDDAIAGLIAVFVRAACQNVTLTERTKYGFIFDTSGEIVRVMERAFVAGVKLGLSVQAKIKARQPIPKARKNQDQCSQTRDLHAHRRPMCPDQADSDAWTVCGQKHYALALRGEIGQVIAIYVIFNVLLAEGTRLRANLLWWMPLGLQGVSERLRM